MEEKSGLNSSNEVGLAVQTSRDGMQMDSRMEKVQHANVHTANEPNDLPEETLAHVVDWSGADDPDLPMNWSNTRKFKNIAVICYCTFLT